MKRYLIGAVAALAFSGVANAQTSPQTPVVGYADRQCGQMTFVLGSSGRREYVTSTNVTHDAAGWSIVHHMSNGNVYSRTSQYDVTDRSNATATE